MTGDLLRPVLDELEASNRSILGLFGGIVAGGGLTREQYFRFLVEEYHREKGHHRHLFEAAGHPDMGTRMEVRRLLLDEANEIEPLYKVIALDLRNLGQTIEPMPFAIELWWVYFNSTTRDRPLAAFGAQWMLNAALERVSETYARMFERPFIRAETSSYVRRVLRTRGDSERYLAVLSAAQLEPRHIVDLRDGVRNSFTLQAMALEWAFGRKTSSDGIG